MLEAPQRRVLFGKEVWDLFADHRAWNVIEKTTKRSYRHWIRRLLKSEKNDKLEPLYLFLWAFSARHRANQNVPMHLSQEDKALGNYYPSNFLDILPQSAVDFGPLRSKVYELLEEAGLVSFESKSGADGEGENPTLTPDPLTGTGDS